MSVGLIEIPGYVTGTWMIDPAHSDVGFVIRHLMISNIKGRFTKFEGQIVTSQDPLQSEVTATIDTTSIDTANATRDEHLRSADFFEADRYPMMSYRSTGIRSDGDGFAMDGELTLKGVTLPVPLTLKLNGLAADPYAPDPAAGARAGFTATGEINRMDFGVSCNGPVPGGGVLLAEKVQIILEIEAALLPSPHAEDRG
jgi:polyisoprenoid-binding protein YceI